MKASESDPRVVRTRQSLRNALMNLLTEKDFVSLTVQDVTERAGIHRTTFYLHYTGLPELLEDCTRTLFKQMRAELDAMAKAQQSATRPEPFIESVFQHLEQHKDFYRVMLGKQGTTLFHELFQSMLWELIFQPLAHDEPVENLPPPLEMMGEFFTSGFRGIAEWWLAKEAPISAEQAAQRITRDILPLYMQLMRTVRKP